MTDERLSELTRPIVGIENRAAQEVFDIMADRIRRSGGVAEQMLVDAFLRGESWRRRNGIAEGDATTFVTKAARDYADATLAYPETTLSETQSGLSIPDGTQALSPAPEGEPVAMMLGPWDMEGDSISWLEGCETLRAGDYLYASPPLTDPVVSVERAAAELERQWEMNADHTPDTWARVARAVLDAALKREG